MPLLTPNIRAGDSGMLLHYTALVNADARTLSMSLVCSQLAAFAPVKSTHWSAASHCYSLS
jgi:hypothetical protein